MKGEKCINDTKLLTDYTTERKGGEKDYYLRKKR
jgi:hypothetical protein